MEILEEGIYNKVKSYLNNGDKVLFIYDIYYENYLEIREGKSLLFLYCIINIEGYNLYGKLMEFKDLKNIFYYNKEFFGIVFKDMISLFKEIGEDLDEIELVGVVINICVISNVVIF